MLPALVEDTHPQWVNLVLFLDSNGKKVEFILASQIQLFQHSVIGDTI